MEAHNTAELSELALVLAAAFAGGAVLKQLNQPVLVGYILVGFLLGPSVMGVVDNQHQISFLAELGILLLLFVIGMELDVRRFAAVYKISVNTTLLQIGASLAITTGIGLMLDWSFSRILLLGFALSLSSTAVGLRLLDDMGELEKPSGNIAVGILVAQDLALIPMLLIIGALGEGGGIEMAGIIKLVIALAVMGGVIIGISRYGLTLEKILPDWLLHPAFKSKDQRTLVALAFCFCAAAFTGTIGLSASYGAFLAGLLIGSTAHSHDYEQEIKPLFDILMMVFFLSVGLMLDLPFMIEHLGVILLVLVGVLFLKSVFNILVLRQMGLSRRHAFTIGASLGQIGEFSFVLAGLGLASAVIQDEFYKYIIAVTALSLMMTPLWIIALRRMRMISLERKRARSKAVKLRRAFPSPLPEHSE